MGDGGSKQCEKLYNGRVASEETKERLKLFYEPWNRELDEPMIEMGFDPPLLSTIKINIFIFSSL